MCRKCKKSGFYSSHPSYQMRFHLSWTCIVKYRLTFCIFSTLTLPLFHITSIALHCTYRLPVHIHDLMVSLVRAEQTFVAQNSRKPSPEELAERLALPLPKVEKLHCGIFVFSFFSSCCYLSQFIHLRGLCTSCKVTKENTSFS